MPSVDPAQAKLMNIAAHTPGGYGGVPQSVGAEFHAADVGQGDAMHQALMHRARMGQIHAPISAHPSIGGLPHGFRR